MRQSCLVTSPAVCELASQRIMGTSKIRLILDINVYLVFSEREKIFKQADEPGVSKNEANKLRSRAALITFFKDIVICINVS